MSNQEMSVIELSQLMLEHGLVIRAIPYEKISICALRHKDRYPDAIVFYDDIRKCEMIKVIEKNANGGKFVITKEGGQSSTIVWRKPVVFYDTIEEALKSLSNVKGE